MGTWLIRNCLLLGPYRRTMPRGPTVVLWGWQFLMSEVPLYRGVALIRNSSDNNEAFL